MTDINPIKKKKSDLINGANLLKYVKLVCWASQLKSSSSHTGPMQPFFKLVNFKYLSIPSVDDVTRVNHFIHVVLESCLVIIIVTLCSKFVLNFDFVD